MKFDNSWPTKHINSWWAWKILILGLIQRAWMWSKTVKMCATVHAELVLTSHHFFQPWVSPGSGCLICSFELRSTHIFFFKGHSSAPVYLHCFYYHTCQTRKLYLIYIYTIMRVKKNRPPIWEWFIPPIKMVMTGGFGLWYHFAHIHRVYTFRV